MGAVGVPLLESKLHAPRRRRGVVPRARLGERLARNALPAGCTRVGAGRLRQDHPNNGVARRRRLHQADGVVVARPARQRPGGVLVLCGGRLAQGGGRRRDRRTEHAAVHPHGVGGGRHQPAQRPRRAGRRRHVRPRRLPPRRVPRRAGVDALPGGAPAVPAAPRGRQRPPSASTRPPSHRSGGPGSWPTSSVAPSGSPTSRSPKAAWARPGAPSPPASSSASRTGHCAAPPTCTSG